MNVREKGSQQQILAFGPYQLFRSQKMLREGDREVRLGGRALDILIVLAERAGEVVSKNELMEYAWPNAIVEENNLRVHLAAIRKILGAGQGNVRYLVNVPGRGYSFVAPVTRIEASRPDLELKLRARPSLPGLLTRVVGRETVIDTLVRQVPSRRFVTIVGAGGVGKTTVAIAIAERLINLYQQVCFVDLSAIEDSSLLLAVLLDAVGVAPREEDPIDSLISHLRDSRVLLVLDNCEHVIAVAAEVVERVLGGTREIDVLATSREPLSATGEQVYHLAPLDCPPQSDPLPVESALKFNAIQLFIERAGGGLEPFEVTSANVTTVAAICRRLDGLPLAIELVAARVSSFGLNAIHEGFGDDLLLTTKGRRTADPRQQSLRATLDWSYRILPVIEQTVLRRLAVFKGLFSAEAAMGVVSAGASAHSVLDALMSLVAKNLLLMDVSGSNIRYRLLHITRAYALEQLSESGEREEILRRHAEHIRLLLEGALENWERLTPEDWLAQYGSMIDDLRSAQHWAFGQRGNIELGVALTVASMPVYQKLHFFGDVKTRALIALNALSRMSPPNPLWELRINNALIAPFVFSNASQELVDNISDRALELARQTGLVRYQIEPMTTRAALHFDCGEYDQAVRDAEQVEFTAMQADEPIAILMADRVAAQAHHFAGNHEQARARAERVLRHPHGAVPLIYAQTPVDRSVSMRIILSRILWLQGFADQAKEIAAEALGLAQGPAACLVLAWASCPIAFWRGDLDSAARLTAQLISCSRRLNVDKWTRLGDCYGATLEYLSGDAAAVAPFLDDPAELMPNGILSSDILATICDGWINSQTRNRAQLNLTGWATPELLRAEGDKQLRNGTVADAEIRFKAAVASARDQTALAWELRATVSLAKLWCQRGEHANALHVLAPLMEKVVEGHSTADFRAARALLAVLKAKPHCTEQWSHPGPQPTASDAL